MFKIDAMDFTYNDDIAEKCCRLHDVLHDDSVNAIEFYDEISKWQSQNATKLVTTIMHQKWQNFLIQYECDCGFGFLCCCDYQKETIFCLITVN